MRAAGIWDEPTESDSAIGPECFASLRELGE
jgi:hypothetical protein